MGTIRLCGLGFVMIFLGYRAVSPLVCCVVSSGLRTTTRDRRRRWHRGLHQWSQAVQQCTVGAQPLSLSMDDEALVSDRSERDNCVTPSSTAVTLKIRSSASLQNDDRFLREVETTVDRVVQKYRNDGINVLASDSRRDEVLLDCRRDSARWWAWSVT